MRFLQVYLTFQISWCWVMEKRDHSGCAGPNEIKAFTKKTGPSQMLERSPMGLQRTKLPHYKRYLEKPGSRSPQVAPGARGNFWWTEGKPGPLGYKLKAINSANNLEELRSSLQMRTQASSHLDFSRVRPWDAAKLCPVFWLTETEITKVCYFKPWNLWYFVTQ